MWPPVMRSHIGKGGRMWGTLDFLDLTRRSRLLYKDRMMLSAILIVTAMAMCMHMMYMRTAVGALVSSRKHR